MRVGLEEKYSSQIKFQKRDPDLFRLVSLFVRINRCGEGLLNTLNFRCKLQFSSSYSHSALFAYPFGHHSRNKYLIPLAEGLFESPTGILRRGLQKILRQSGRSNKKPFVLDYLLSNLPQIKCKRTKGFFLPENPNSEDVINCTIYNIFFFFICQVKI